MNITAMTLKTRIDQLTQERDEARRLARHWYNAAHCPNCGDQHPHWCMACYAPYSDIISSPTTHTILQYIRQYQTDNGKPPTIREITQGCGLKSKSTTDYHLTKLTQAGIISREPNTARGIKLHYD